MRTGAGLVPRYEPTTGGYDLLELAGSNRETSDCEPVTG